MVRPRGAGPAPVAVSPTSPLVLAAEQARGHMGRTVPVPLTAAAGTVDLAARQVPAWLYDGKPPGGTIRLSRGDQLDVTLRDGLPEPTRNRWHGLALPKNMDGTPGLNQDSSPQADLPLQLRRTDLGTCFCHRHIGLQLHMGLAAVLVVKDPSEPAAPTSRRCCSATTARWA